MKTVISSHSELAHLWANQTQSYARASNMSFEGTKLFSYGTVIAEICSDRNGAAAVVFDSASFSNSTCKHQNYARRAASHLPRYFVQRGRRGQSSLVPTRQDVDAILARCSELHKAGQSGAMKWRLERLQSIAGTFETAVTLAKVFKLGRVILPAYIRKDITPEKFAEMAAEIQRREIAGQTPEALARKERERARRAELKAAKEEAERVEKQKDISQKVAEWKAGLRHVLPYGAPMALRLQVANPSGGYEVQTSHGARVPLRSALRLFKVCNKCAAHKTEFIPATENGFRVGVYALQMITADGSARVGCHFLPFAEMAELFAKLTPEQVESAEAEQTL